MKSAVAWCLLFLAIGLPLQGAFELGQQLAKPAHYHQRSARSVGQHAPPVLPYWVSDIASDISDGHRHPHPHPAPATESESDQHSRIADHAHEPGEPGVVYVSGQGDELDQGSSLLRAGADPFWGLLPAALELPPGVAAVVVTRWIEPERPSHASFPPEKPPRA